MLSLRKGKRKVARIKGGKHDGAVIYLHDSSPDIVGSLNSNKSRSKLLSKSFFNRHKRMKKTDAIKLKKAINNTTQSESSIIKSLDKHLHVIFKDALEDVKKNEKTGMKTQIHVSDGKIIPLPDKNIIEKIYVSAPSGAGKSYWCGNWLKEFKKMFKDDEIYLFSKVTQDKALDVHDPIRVELSADLLDEPIEPSDMSNSVVMFDDTDRITNPKIRRNISDLRDLLLENGRHDNIRMLVTSHLLMDYRNTKCLLNEATAVCFFPKGGNTYHIKKFLTTYVGLDTEQIQKILNLPSRWVCLYKHYPMFVMYDKGVYMV